MALISSQGVPSGSWPRTRTVTLKLLRGSRRRSVGGTRRLPWRDGAGPRGGSAAGTYFLFAYQSASIFVKCAHFSGSSSSGKMAWTGQTGTHAPQSMQVSGSM